MGGGDLVAAQTVPLLSFLLSFLDMLQQGGLLTHACVFKLKLNCYSKADGGFSTFSSTEVFTSDDPCFVVSGRVAKYFLFRAWMTFPKCVYI